AAVTDLTDYWNGLGRTLDPSVFKPGSTYSFSAMAMQNTTASEHFKLSLEYNDASGTQSWDIVAEADGSKGEWVQLENTEYTIPAGASGMTLYVETDETTTPFFVDEAVGGVKGAKYTADVVKPTETPAGSLTGDVNSDKKVDLLDIVALQKYLLGLDQTISNDATDLNKDNRIDIFDLGLLKGLVIRKQNNPDPEPTEPPTEAPTEAPTEKPTEAAPQRVDGVFYNTADVSWIDPNKPMVALAFDDGPIGGPDAQNPIRIQNAISENGGHSTFFYWGERIAGNEAEIKRAHDLGMEIANHTWTHPDMTTLSADQQREQIMKTANKLTELTGETDFLIRPPYLKTNDSFSSVAKSCNSALINCSVYSNDWDGASKDAIKNTILTAMQNGSLNGAVVLMHENYPTTAGAIEEVAPILKANGWQMVTVSEMFKAKGKTLYNGKLYNKLSDAN
ncbi:MAG: polysaccharide deacetylase family protein, partial [Oscillospiraceae bacterium]|nr:polysaccharide deacetylase family protein [Oscillospiraceae bacterium]